MIPPIVVGQASSLSSFVKFARQLDRQDACPTNEGGAR